MAAYVDPPIYTETCDFVVQLLRSSLSDSVYTQFASAAFEDLAAMCELALPPPSTLDRRVELDFDDKCAVVQLMQTVASCGELSGDSITLALLRLIWSCSSSEEIQRVAQPAQTLLLGMGVTKDNFFHVLPKHPQPIAADIQCYLEDQCCADEQSLDYQLVCGHSGHHYCMLEYVFVNGKCPKCRHVCVFEMPRRDSSASDSGDGS